LKNTVLGTFMISLLAVSVNSGLHRHRMYSLPIITQSLSSELDTYEVSPFVQS